MEGRSFPVTPAFSGLSDRPGSRSNTCGSDTKKEPVYNFHQSYCLCQCNVPYLTLEAKASRYLWDSGVTVARIWDLDSQWESSRFCYRTVFSISAGRKSISCGLKPSCWLKFILAGSRLFCNKRNALQSVEASVERLNKTAGERLNKTAHCTTLTAMHLYNITNYTQYTHKYARCSL